MVSKLWRKSILGILAFILVFQFFPYSNGKVEAADSWNVENPAGTSDLYNITFSNNEFVAVGTYGTIKTSADGTNWSDHSVDANHFYDVLYTGTQWIAAGQYGDMGTSPDGESWHYGYSLSPTFVKGLASNGSIVIAVGSGGQIMASLDNGSSWTNQATFEVQFNDVTYGNGEFVAVGNGGVVYTSTDGTEWSPNTILNGGNINQITYGGSQFVAVGDDYIYTSSDGNDWASYSLPSDLPANTSLYGIAYASGKYVAVGSRGVIVSSPDGNAWTTENSPTTTDLKSVTAGNGKFVAVGIGGQVLTQDISSNNADLVNLTLSQGTLAPSFLAETTDYTASVGHEVSSVDVTATVADPHSTLTINGAHADSGSAINVLLNVGENPITVVVTSGNGTTKPYSIVVTRAAASGSSNTDGPTPGPSGTQSSSTPAVSSGSNVEEITVDVQTAKSNDNTTVAKTLVKRTTEADGTKKDDVTFTTDKVEETLKQILSQGLDTARIVIPDKEDIVSQVNVTVPKLSVDRLSEGQANLEIYTENAMIGIPKASLQQFDQDLYFKFIPIKDASGKKNAEERAKADEIVQEIAKDATSSIQVLGRPMTIETNMQSRPVTLTMPLRDADLPANAKQRQHVLDNVSVFIEHSDNTKELKKGKVVTFPDGSQGIEISVDKFSTFTMVYMDGEPHNAYIKGYSDHTFRPEAFITRAEMAAMLSRNLDPIESSATVGYTDVNNQNWAFNEILRVQQYGIMVGDKGVFRPNSSITRAEMAAIVNHWLKKDLGEDSTAAETDNGTSTYTDTANNWAVKDIEAIKGLNIMEGYEDGSFRPNAYLTRAEAVKVLNRLFNRGPLYGTYTPSFNDVNENHWAYREVEEAARNHTYSISEEGQELLVNNLD